jgi:hypothetical protein
MNLNIGIAVWIILLNIVLLIILYIKSHTMYKYVYNVYIESYEDSIKKSDPDANDANINYALLLNYIKNNPSNANKFINDIRQRFFRSDCSTKSIIDYNSLTSNVSMVF